MTNELRLDQFRNIANDLLKRSNPSITWQGKAVGVLCLGLTVTTVYFLINRIFFQKKPPLSSSSQSPAVPLPVEKNQTYQESSHGLSTIPTLSNSTTHNTTQNSSSSTNSVPTEDVQLSHLSQNAGTSSSLISTELIKTEFGKIQSEWGSLKNPSYYLQQNQDPHTVYEKQTIDCLNHIFEFIWNLKDETDPLIFKCIRECFTNFASIIIIPFPEYFHKEIKDKKYHINRLISKEICLFRLNRIYSPNSSPFTLFEDGPCPNFRIDIQTSNQDQKFLRCIPFKFLTFNSLGDVKEICQRYDETNFSDEEEEHLEYLAFEFMNSSLKHVVFLKATSCKFLGYFLKKYCTSHGFGSVEYDAFISLKNEKEILKKLEIFGCHLKLIWPNRNDDSKKLNELYILLNLVLAFNKQKPNFHQIISREYTGKPFRLYFSLSRLLSFIPEEFLKDPKKGFEKIRNHFNGICSLSYRILMLRFCTTYQKIESLNREQPSNSYERIPLILLFS